MKNLLAGLILLGFVSNVGAVTIGSLSYDESVENNEIITDSLNNLEWLRWDVLENLDYAQTLSAIATNGAYDGWNIAHNSQAQMFTDALLGSNPCSLVGYTLCHENDSPIDYAAVIGDNYYANPGYDYAFYLSDNVGEEVGYIEALSPSSGASTIRKYNDWNSIAASDQFAANNTAHVSPISWLLYRAPANVSEASSIYILAFGLLGLLLVARRKV